jgi:PAS domain S-box-containing protein
MEEGKMPTTKPKIRFLIVEDVPTDAELVVHEIRRTGLDFEEMRVETEAAFVAALDDFKPDIILSDYRLPTFDGVSAMRIALKRAPLTPFLVVTGSMNEETAVECMKSGATDYILKEHIRQLCPAIIAALRKKEVVLEKARMERALKESEEKFRLVAELAPVFILIHQGGNWIYANSVSQQISGFTPDELCRTPFWEIAAPEAQPGAKEWGLRLLDGRPAPTRDEIPIRTRDGKSVWVDVAAGKIEIGGKPAVITAGVDITQRRADEEAIKASLAEKEVLLREIHHRVKNNMQVIISLINLQAKRVSDPAGLQMLKDAQRRIFSMALVHEKLYQSDDFSHINMASYIQGLIAHVFHTLHVDTTRVAVRTDIGGEFLDINTALPCGLLITELVSNALEHAFPEERTGTVKIAFRRGREGRFTLTVGDDGVGLPRGLDIRNTETLGLQLVMMLIDQLDGTIAVRTKKGTEFTVEFGELSYKPRF